MQRSNDANEIEQLRSKIESLEYKVAEQNALIVDLRAQLRLARGGRGADARTTLSDTMTAELEVLGSSNRTFF